MNRLKNIELKMRKAGLSNLALFAFRRNYLSLLEGQTGLIAEAEIEAIVELPRLENIQSDQEADQALMAQVAVLKLNGGLGTSMGLDRAKSLLVVKEGYNFLDLIARQVQHLRKKYGCEIPFCLMNSFSTQTDTLDYLKRYPDLAGEFPLDFLQSKVPKIDAETLEAVCWTKNEQLEWCPPGHGDLYLSLAESGLLDAFLDQGIAYLFVSNADNLGASLDPEILRYFAQSELPFLMEVAERTVADSKGGHLALRKSNGQFLLRESAQCPEQDQAHFQDTKRHRFFNTNNLWIHLETLKNQLNEHGGSLPLPLIRNAKTVDPQDSQSPRVYQLETAMGAAIEVFPGAGALVVPRTRFAPVKNTSDLLCLQSDAYRMREDWTLQQSPDCVSLPSIILDDRFYKKVGDYTDLFSEGIPSLKKCQSLRVKGCIKFSSEVQCEGAVSICSDSPEQKVLPSGTYCSEVLL